LSEPRIGGIIPLWQLKEKIPFFVLSIIMVIITLYNPNTPDMSDSPGFKQFPLIPRLANAPVAFVTYLGKTLWPHNMAAFYPFPDQIPLWQVMGASLLILIITTAVIVMIKRLPYLFAGWMWFSIIIAPVIGILQVSISAPYAMADRYHYLPSIGLAVGLAWGIPALISNEAIRKKIILPVGIIFLAVISFISWNQCGYWKSSIELWNHALRVTKNNNNNKYLAHNGLALALFAEGRIDQAFIHYNEAIRLKPDNARLYNYRARAYTKLGQYQHAFEDYNEAIRLKPDYANGYNDRGNAYTEIGQYQRALQDYNEAIRLNPNYEVLYNNRGLDYTKLGQYQRAVEDYNEAIRLRLNYADAYNNRATAYVNMGQYQLAINDYNKAITVKPDYADAYKNREFVYFKLGKQHTLEDYNEAIRLRPNYADAFNNRGVVYAKRGQYQRAIEDYTKAISLKPDYADAYNNRGITYFKQGSKKLCCDDLQKACKLGNCKILEAAKNSGDCR
jgi:tetratricopeptide (TPR) repeat protein